MVTKKWITVLGLSLWIFTACNLAAKSRTTQPTISSLPVTNTTPVLATPTTPPLIVLNQFLENAHIVSVDTFDDPSGWNPTNDISNGWLLLVGRGDNSWHGLSNKAVFQAGTGVIINFEFTPGEFFEMYFEQGPWTTDLYKRFGVYVNEDHSNANLFIGKQRTDFHPLSGNLAFNKGTWYSLLMVVGEGGNFLTLIWDPTDPQKNLQYRTVMENWRDIRWTFRIQLNTGAVLFDDFQEIQFDRIK